VRYVPEQPSVARLDGPDPGALDWLALFVPCLHFALGLSLLFTARRLYRTTGT
jgi:hypothetical protein